MQAPEHVHAFKVPFPALARFVYIYMIYGKQVSLVDNGIAPAKEMIFAYLRKTGPEEA